MEHPVSRTHESASPGAAEANQQSSRLQFGLIELIILVSSIGLMLGVARHTTTFNWQYWQYTYDPYGLLLIPGAIWLAAKLVAEVVFLLRNRLADDRQLRARECSTRASVLWRVTAIVMLACFVATESAAVWLSNRARDTSGLWMLETSTRIVAVCGLILIIGIVLGSQQVKPAKPAVTRTSRSFRVIGWFVLVVFAIAAAMQGIVIEYLVLIAVEAVSMAIRFWEGNGPGALARLSHGSVPVVLCVAACVASGVWQSYDLRHHRTVDGQADGRDEHYSLVMFDLVCSLAPAAAGLFIVLRFLPSVHTQYAQGIWRGIMPMDGVVIFFGIAGFSAGIAARALGAPSIILTDTNLPDRRDSVIPVATFARVTIALVSIAALSLSLVAIFSKTTAMLFHERILGITSPVVAMWGWIGGQLDSTVLYLSVGLAWVTVSTFRAMCTRTTAGYSYFDSIVNPNRLRLFLWAWFRLTLLMISAMPTIFVAGLLSYHYFLMLFD
jgi:hypothetical protein